MPKTPRPTLTHSQIVDAASDLALIYVPAKLYGLAEMYGI